ncbi:MAG: hypothetical protein RSA20_11420, partial [Oscillospiraceae bacterium]
KARNTEISSEGKSYGYLTITATSKVADNYEVRPYFYTKVEYSGSPNPSRLVSIEYGNIDRNYNGVSKQFTGILYYNLENIRTIYFDLNGDFYNNGTTNVGGGESVGIDGSATLNFSNSHSREHFKYIRDTQRHVIADIV